MFLNQLHLPLHFHQQQQSPFCHKHNEPVKGLCFFSGKCEDRLMCRLCRKFHDNTHLNYYEELEDLFRKDSVVRDLKVSLETTINVLKTQNSTYENNSGYIISQINYLYKEIETNILQKLTQTRDMLTENTNKKVGKNNAIRQEIITILENMSRAYDQAMITRFNPPSTAEDMVQAICKAQALKDRIEGDIEFQSQETISYSITRLATTVSGNLFQQIKLSLDQIYQDISGSFSLESVTKLPSVGKGKLTANMGMLQENAISGHGLRTEKAKSPFNKVIHEDRGFRPERSKSPFNKVTHEERAIPGQNGEKCTPLNILQIFQSVEQEENKQSVKKRASTTVALTSEAKDAARASRSLMDFLNKKTEESNPRQGGIRKKRLLEYQNERVTNHKQIMFGGLTYVANKEEIVTAGTDGCIQILNAKDLESKYTFNAHKGEITRLLYVPEKGLLLSAGIDGKINVWDYLHRCKLLHSFTKHNAVVYALEYLPESDLVISGGEDENIRMWNINTCKELQAMRTADSKIGSICKLGNTRRIAVGFDKGVVNIISLGQVKKVAYSIKAHNAYVFNLAYVEDQKLLITGAEDGFVKIWKVLETKGECIRRLSYEGATVRSFVVLPEKDLIISNYNDSHVRLWKISTGQKLDDMYDNTFGESIVAIYNNDEVVTANHNQVKQWAISL